MQDLPPLGVDKDNPILKKNKFSTGISELDILMEGGYPNPYNVLLVGPTGMEKSAMAFAFASSKKDGEVLIFITTDANAATIKEKAASIGIKLPEDTIFIDCYSNNVNSLPEQENIIYMGGPSALEDFSVTIKEILEKNIDKKFRVIFHTFSTFLLYNNKDSMLKFLQVVGGRLKNANATTLILVEEGVHDKQLISMILRYVDEHINLIDKGTGVFNIEFQNGLQIPVKIGLNGINII